MRELDRLDESVQGLDKKIDDFQSAVRGDIQSLKMKAATWGAAAGAIPVGLALAYQILIK